MLWNEDDGLKESTLIWETDYRYSFIMYKIGFLLIPYLVIQLTLWPSSYPNLSFHLSSLLCKCSVHVMTSGGFCYFNNSTNKLTLLFSHSLTLTFSLFSHNVFSQTGLHLHINQNKIFAPASIRSPFLWNSLNSLTFPRGGIDLLKWLIDSLPRFMEKTLSWTILNARLHVYFCITIYCWILCKFL